MPEAFTASPSTDPDDPLASFDWSDDDPDGDFELTCPGCGARLGDQPLYDGFRICPGCRRHFWMPARERLALLVDPGSFKETSSALASIDPLIFRDTLPVSDGAATGREPSPLPIGEVVVTGTAEIGGQSTVVLIVDFAHLGSSIGVVAGEKITLAIGLAANRRLPLVAVLAGGASRRPEGMLALMQSARIAGGVNHLRRSGIPFVAILTHPTTGPVFASLAAHADLLIAEPGTQIGLGSVREPGADPLTESSLGTAETLLDRGQIDAILDRTTHRDQLTNLLDMLGARGVPRPRGPVGVPRPVGNSGSREAEFALHPERPTSRDYLNRVMPAFFEIQADRDHGLDPAIITGIGQIDGVTVAVVAQQRPGIASAPSAPGPRMTAAGYRKAERLAHLAARLDLPIVLLIDGPAPFASSHDDDADLALEMARTQRTFTAVTAPTLSIVLGEAGGIGAMAFGVADRALMLEHAVYSVSSTEMPRVFDDRLGARHAPRYLTSRECLRVGIIDAIVPEPAEGAHVDPAAAAQQLRLALAHTLAEIRGIAPRRLIDEREKRLRLLGHATPEGREAINLEMAQLQEWQRSIGKSLDDLRTRLEQRQLALPTLPQLPSRPTMPPLGLPVRPNLPTLHRPAVNRAEIADLAGRLAATGRGLADRVSEARTSPGSTPSDPFSDQES